MNMSARTDKGQVRSVNEDNFYVSDGDFTYLVVADGMGGHKGGQTASKMAIENVKMFLCESRMKNNANIKEALLQCVENVNLAIYKKASLDDELAGMGTTLVILYKDRDTAYIANVGDSRCYLVRDGNIKQITKDHSVVQELFDKGKIERKDMRTHPNKNMITRAVGTNFSVKCDIYELSIEKNDGFILCSDGLSNMLEDEEILNAYMNSSDTEDCVDKLIKKANEAGGTDNITVIAAKL